MSLTPVGESKAGAQIRLARVLVSDRGGEEFPEAFFGFRRFGEQGRGGAGEDARRDGVGGVDQWRDRT